MQELTVKEVPDRDGPKYATVVISGELGQYANERMERKRRDLEEVALSTQGQKLAQSTAHTTSHVRRASE